MPTARAALCRSLLDGNVLNVMNCFKTISLTNIGREIPRMVEKPFGVTVSRVHRTGKSKYGQAVQWVDYRLNKTPMNKEGIEKMREYVAKNFNPKTTQQLKQTSLL